MLKLTSLIAALCLLGACAKVNSYNTNSAGNVIQRGSGLARVDVSIDTLQGTWKTHCTSPSKESHYTSAITFKNGMMITITESFADPDCKFIIDQEIRNSRFTEDMTSDGLSRVNETLILLQYTTRNDAMTSIFNKTQFCAITSWSTNVQVNIPDPAKCNVKNILEFHAEIYGSQELYLDDCAGASCSALRYQKVVSP